MDMNACEVCGDSDHTVGMCPIRASDSVQKPDEEQQRTLAYTVNYRLRRGMSLSPLFSKYGKARVLTTKERINARPRSPSPSSSASESNVVPDTPLRAKKRVTPLKQSFVIRKQRLFGLPNDDVPRGVYEDLYKKYQTLTVDYNRLVKLYHVEQEYGANLRAKLPPAQPLQRISHE